jgi:hypothetical protein
MNMIKKTVLALFSLVFALALITPAKANAQVVVRVAPRPYVYVAPPYPAYYGPYAYPGRVFIGGRWYPRPYAYGYVGPHRYGWRR